MTSTTVPAAGPPSGRALRGRSSPTSRAPRPESSGTVWGLLVLIGALVVIGLYASTAFASRGATIGAFPAMAVVSLIAGLLISRCHDPAFDVRSIMWLGLVARFIGAFFRLRNPVDAGVYHDVGVNLASGFRQFHFIVDTGRPVPGSGTIRYMAGLAQVVTFDDLAATFMIWTLFSFVGCWLLYRAFALALPDGDRPRYAVALFLWPSLAFWPNSIGKEGWMLLSIGVASYGAAMLLNGRAGRGFAVLGAGLVMCALVRPHVGLLVVVGVVVALVMRRNTATGKGLALKLVGVVVLVIGGMLLVSQTAKLLKVDDLGTDEVTSALSSTQDQTTQGGSAFTAAVVRTPLDYPKAFVTVLFRPFPNEARDLNGLMTAAESGLLLVLLVTSYRRFGRLPRLLRDRPYTSFALAYVLAFVYAFSSIGNFGILARQRTQVIPMVLVMVALPRVSETLPRFGKKRREALAARRAAGEDVPLSGRHARSLGHIGASTQPSRAARRERANRRHTPNPPGAETAPGTPDRAPGGTRPNRARARQP